MAIKAIFPPDKDSITVTGLYQWDYGQQLEIDAEGLPEYIEVHFSCTSMTEAIVRDCVYANGVYTVTIPDDCLEQASPITVWIYDWSVTQGKTVKVITLPVVARTRPSRTREISEDDADAFAKLITDLNAAVEGLKNGEIKVKSAETADTAGTVSGFTGVVESANFATQATKARQDYKGNVIHNTYSKIADESCALLQKDLNKPFSDHTFHNQTDKRIKTSIQLRNKELDDVVAIGFSFVYTDANNREHYLEAHGIKSTQAATETVAPSITSPHIHISCKVSLSDKNYAGGLGADSSFFVGSVTVELSTLGDGTLLLRFVGEHVFALNENGVLARITGVGYSLYEHCVLKDVFVYAL